MPYDADFPDLDEAIEALGVAKTSPELAEELYLAPRANLKGRLASSQAAALVAFLDEAYPRPPGRGAKTSYHAGPKRTATRREGIAALLAELLIAAVVEDNAAWLMISLDKDDYTKAPVSWRTFDGIRQPWKSAGLLEEITGYAGSYGFGNPGPVVGRVSRFRATPKMLEVCSQHGITVDNASNHFAVEFDMPSELVQITSPSFPTPDTPTAHRLRDEVRHLNAFFSKHVLSGARHIGWVRMFHEATDKNFKFNKGGRLYSQPSIAQLNYQSMPRDRRVALTINGEALTEIDISGSYLTIFYAAHGRKVDVAGAYDGILGPSDIERAIVKAWINNSFGHGALLRQWSAGIKAEFAKRHIDKGWQIDPKLYPVAGVREATLKRHPLLATWGEVGPGIPSTYGDLMYRESRVIISTMLRLANEHSIPSLPVHDSILVPRSKVLVAASTLEEQFMAVVGVIPALKEYP